MAISLTDGSTSIGRPYGFRPLDVALGVGLLLTLLGVLFVVGSIYLSVAAGVALSVHVFGLVPVTDFDGFDNRIFLVFFACIGLLIVI